MDRPTGSGAPCCPGVGGPDDDRANRRLKRRINHQSPAGDRDQSQPKPRPSELVWAPRLGVPAQDEAVGHRHEEGGEG